MTSRIFLLACLSAACGGTSAASDASADGPSTSDVTAPQDASSDATGPDATTADAATKDAAPGAYTAHGYSGGLEHLFIYKADPQRKLCFEIALAAPTTNTSGLVLPAQWGMMTATAFSDDKACVFGYGGDAGVALASGQSGSIDWPDSGFQIPTMITSLDVTLDFDAGPSWAPPSELLSATNVPVQ